MNARDLLRSCIDVYLSFRPAQTTLDTHIEEAVAGIEFEAEEDEEFVREVVYGCYRYKKIIDAVLSSFYRTNANTSRADRDLYMVLAFLAVLRLEDLTFDGFRRFILAHDSLKMMVLLQFIFNKSNLETYMRPAWIQAYDAEYVDGVLIADLERFEPNAMELIAFLKSRVEGPAIGEGGDGAAGGESRGPKRQIQLKPFNLTQPKARAIPKPAAIAIEPKAKPVPSTTYAPDNSTELAIERAKEARKAKQAKQSKHKPFDLQTDQRTSNLEAKRKAVEEERQRKIDATRVPPKKPPTVTKEGPVVKLNAATILRDEANIKRRLEEEARRIMAFEAELRDQAEFEQWQAQMRAQDEAKREMEMERRRLATQLSAEEAMAARRRKAQEKRKVVESLRADAQTMEMQRRKERESVVHKAKETVVQVQEKRFVGNQTRKEMAKKRQQEAKALRVELDQVRRQKAEEEREEQERKADMIRQIRALENVPSKQTKVLDRASTSGLGLLSEMSDVESKERLALQKVKEEEERERKRMAILEEKQEKERELMGKMESISRFKALAEQRAVERHQERSQKLKTAKQRQEEAHKEQLLILQEKLAKKREERMAEKVKLAAERKAIRTKNQFLRADKSNIEEQKFAQLEAGAERMARERHGKGKK